jgi:thiopurine S-methyltransferase
MDPDFWHERWKTNQIGFHQGDINPYLIRYWPSLGLNAGARVFVPLCGKSRDMFWLLQQGYSVVGVEISPIAVESFFAENRLTPGATRESRFIRWRIDALEILCADFFELEKGDIGNCQGVYDRAALIALPPDMRPRYVDHLSTLLDPHATGLLVTLEYNQSEMGGPPFSVSDAEVSRLFAETYSVRLLCQTDILKSKARFKEQGLTRLSEQAWRVESNKQACEPDRSMAKNSGGDYGHSD